MWPCRAGEAVDERRFFAAGGFFTDGRRARFVAPEPPRLHAALSEIFPLRLNTGRVRDQWHTMTRTGTSQRLCAHSPEPFVEIHPNDAAAAGLDDGGFARITTQHGSAILKVATTAGQQSGLIFAPIHWSDTTAAHARVGDMVSAATDPFSGQPEAKATPARIERVDYAYRGFALTRRPITLPAGMWFARLAVAGGSGLLLATNDPPGIWHDLAVQLMPQGADFAEYIDQSRGLVRIAAFHAGRLEGVVFVGPAAAPPHWDAVRTLFASPALKESERRVLLSGRSGEGMAETGPLICACFEVGLATIRDAIVTGGAADVAAIGRTLRAGTNCGSCVPELRKILEGVRRVV